MSVFPERLSVLIVDDEKKACTNLQNLLLNYVDPSLNIIAMVQSTADAEAQIKKQVPDAIFLDIEMPNENAFQFLERMAPFTFDVVFVTAYDEYALRAFKLNAVDYILKPISIEELKSAVQRLKERAAYRKVITNTPAFYSELSANAANKQAPQRITLRDANIMEVVDLADICYIEAQGSYSKINFFKLNKLKEVTMSRPLSDYEELFPAEAFFRIHRAYLINCAYVKEIIIGDINTVILEGSTAPLPVSRRRYTPLREFLNKGNYYSD